MIVAEIPSSDAHPYYITDDGFGWTYRMPTPGGNGGAWLRTLVPHDANLAPDLAPFVPVRWKEVPTNYVPTEVLLADRLHAA